MYKRAAKNVGWLLTLLAAAGAASIVIVLPLWYAATHSRQVYTIIVVSAGAVALITYITIRVIRGMKQSGRGFWTHIGGIVGKLSILVLFIFGLYGIIWLFSERLYAPAGICLAVYLVLAGFYRSWRSRKKKHDVNDTRILPS